MKDFKKNIKTLIFGLFLTLIIAGCKSDGEEIEQPEKIYYDQAQARMSSGNYCGAIESLEAQIELIYAHFMNTETEAAHSAAEKFIRLHPRHPNIDYAYFMKGLSSYTRDRDLLIRFTDTDISNRDVSGAKASFAELTEFITRFPDSQYVSYAKQRNIYLRNLIAKSELSAADYYLTIDAHVGAIRRANYVIENIPNSSENYRALKILEESYEALGYTELLEDVRQVLSSNYSGEESNQTSRTREWSWNFLDRPDKKDE